jgi:hypothetical protein
MSTRTLILLVSALAAGAPAAAGAGERGPFTVAVLPDTQKYAERYPETFTAQTSWIKDNLEKENIKFVAHVGDVVNQGYKEEQWQNADRSMKLLDGVVPYGIAPGNHDYNGTSRRNTTLFNKYFPPSRFSRHSWYGGGFDESNDNSYQTFKAAGMDFLVVCLELAPRDEVLKWAGDLVARHPGHRTIVVTHCYMNVDGKLVKKTDKFGPNTYVKVNNDGEEMWAKFVSRHENIFMVLNGHMLARPGLRLSAKGQKGNTVHQLLANYQGLRNGGNGWLRLMKFVPAQDRIEVSTYSPTLDKFWEEKNPKSKDDHRFTLDYDMD